jgi:hypothetical protein
MTRDSQQSPAGDEAWPHTQIGIQVDRIEQLFNSLDPSPFHDKDIDRDAEAYIVDSVDEFPLTKPLSLIIAVPADQLSQAKRARVAEAIQNYFLYRLRAARHRMHFQFREGRMMLLLGLAFLAVCMFLRQFALSYGPSPTTRVLEEGLLILGWVAMWRPLEAFLYDWWPLRHSCKLLQKLSTIQIEVRCTDPSANGYRTPLNVAAPK